MKRQAVSAREDKQESFSASNYLRATDLSRHGEWMMMKIPLRSQLLLAIALCGCSLLGACTAGDSNTGTKFNHSSGTPVNPNTDPAGQGVPGSRSTGANSRQSPGLQ